MKLYEITQDYKALDDLFAESINEETGEIKEGRTLTEFQGELQKALTEKSTAIIGILRDADLGLEMISKEIDRLSEMKKRAEKKTSQFRNYILWNMEQLGTKKIETPIGTLSIRTSKSVAIDDNKLYMNDPRYTTEVIQRKVSKTEIKKLLESGEIIPGAAIEEKTFLQVR